DVCYRETALLVVLIRPPPICTFFPYTTLFRSWRGIKCILVEKGDGSVFQPRMDMVGIRTMEFCRRWGIVDWVENAGYNRDYPQEDRKSTRLNSSHVKISYAVFCLKKKNQRTHY